MRYGLFLLLIFFVTNSLQGRNTFNHLTVSDGLNEGTINSIAQDSSGVMWFATYDGLIQYDGFMIRTFLPEIENPLSLPSKKTTGLLVDSRNNLWITLGGNQGITRFKSDKEIFQTYEIDFLHPMSKLYDIVELQDFIITNQLRSLHYISLDSLDGDFRLLKVYDSEMVELVPANNIIRIGNYLLIYNRRVPLNKTELFFAEIITREDEIFAQVVRKESVPFIVYDVKKFPVDNVICFATKSGLKLYSFNESFEYAATIKENEHFTKLMIVGSTIWLASQSNGVYSYDLHTGNINQYQNNPDQPRSLLGNIVFSMYHDFSSNLWFGHAEEGVSILNSNFGIFNAYQVNSSTSQHVPGNSILSFHNIDDGMLVGTRYQGLNAMRGIDSENAWFDKIEFPDFFEKNNNIHESVWDIKRESDNLLWMATSYGLVKAIRSGNSWNFEQVFTLNEVGLLRKIFIDENRNLWFGGYAGLYLMPYTLRDSGIYYHYLPDDRNSGSLSNVVISDIFLSSDGGFYIGTMNGVNILKPSYYDLNFSGMVRPELSFEHLKAGSCEKTLNNNEINSFFESFDGSIWICTQGGGINIYNKRLKKISCFEEKDGLPSNNVFGILKDRKNRLWISTSKGLMNMSQNGNSWNISRFTVNDGIQGNMFVINAYYASNDGKMYFGGTNGFTSFNPNEFRENTIAPRIRISSLSLNGREINFGDTIDGRILLNMPLTYLEEIKLPHNLNSLSIGIAVIHYQNPENNTLMFKLDNFDEYWTTMPAGQFYIRYPGLAPGNTYLLRVKGMGANGVISDMEKTIKITINQQWWKTRLAQATFMLVFMMVVFTLSLLIIIREKLKIKLKLDSIRIKEDQRKLDFFTNISHDIRTPICLITAPIKDLKDNFNSYDRSSIDQQLSLIDRNAQSLLRLANHLLNFDRYSKGIMTLSLQKVDLDVYISGIVDNFRKLQVGKNKRLNFYLSPEKLYVKIDPDKFEQALNNILSNAFTYAKEEGEISVSYTRSTEKDDLSGNMVKITIFNEGNEIPQDKLAKIFERYYQEKPSFNGGFGIGLAIAKSITDLHNGHIKAESIKDRGVAFHLFIPLLKSEERRLPEGKSKQYYPGLNDYCPAELDNVDLIEIDLPEDNELTILVIEDNPELRLFLKTILSKGYKFIEAASGNEGVRIAQEEIPDLIISDIMMPGLNGIEVCNILKEDIRTSHIPVILLTAKGTQESILAGYGSGADAYIVKPFEVNLLISQINSMIENRRLIQEKYQSKGFEPELNDENFTVKDRIFLKKLKKVIMQNSGEHDFNVNMLSEQLNICPTYLYRKLKALTGYSPVELIRNIRLNNALKLIKSNKYTVKEVCYLAGFNNFSYFIKCFKKEFGITPTMVQKAKAGDNGISLN
jgi:signal transduction histidine kinase/DNA-binding response OmpR family regulator/ligand-binding sensor domain-containing protein